VLGVVLTDTERGSVVLSIFSDQFWLVVCKIALPYILPTEYICINININININITETDLYAVKSKED
jgi:hypothetical protein